MTPRLAGLAVLAGLVLTLAGLLWLFGPWVLVGAGVLLSTAGLLWPHREPSEDEIAEAVRKALGQS